MYFNNLTPVTNDTLDLFSILYLIYLICLSLFLKSHRKTSGEQFGFVYISGYGFPEKKCLY